MSPTNSSQIIKIGCVPEHYSAPIYQTESNRYRIESCPGGTGQMVSQLHSGILDLACCLTEGIVLRACADLLDNSTNPIKIYGSFTKSPLIWAISISTTSNIITKTDIKRVAISRFGSGSHIIAVLLSKSIQKQFEFIVCNDIHGMIDSVQSGAADAFLWEVVTTQPYYDSGKVKLLDTISPQWPSFCMATTLNSLKSKNTLLSEFRNDLGNTIPKFVNTFHTHGINYIMERKDVFHYENEQWLKDWFEKVEFVDDLQLFDKDSLRNCFEILVNANMIDRERIELYKIENNCDDIVDLLIF